MTSAARRSVVLARFSAAYARTMRVSSLPADLFNAEAEARRVAYHEAGHAVMQMFSGCEPTHVDLISIIPRGETLGRCRSSRGIAERLVCARAMSPTDLLCVGRQILLRLLGGRVAEAMFADPETNVLDEDSEEWSLPGSDLYRAFEIASAMTQRRFPVQRNLAQADRWCREAFAIPEVERTTQAVAGALLEHGRIGHERISALCAPVYCMALRRSRWTRRLCRPATTELDHAYVSDARRRADARVNEMIAAGRLSPAAAESIRQMQARRATNGQQTPPPGQLSD